MKINNFKMMEKLLKSKIDFYNICNKLRLNFFIILLLMLITRVAQSVER
jgi:hypothetical protein